MGVDQAELKLTKKDPTKASHGRPEHPEPTNRRRPSQSLQAGQLIVIALV